jgi:hypothetical protein
MVHLSNVGVIGGAAATVVGFLGCVLGGGVWAAALLSVGVNLALPVGIIATGLVYASAKKTKSLTLKNLNRDIINGELIIKYKNEVVDKQLQELPATAPAEQKTQLTALSQRLSDLAEKTKAQFNNAANDTQPAKPVQKLRLSLRRHHIHA